MAQISIELDFKKVEEIIKQLNEQERQKLVEKLITEDFEAAVKKFRKNIKKKKLSAKEINQLVEEARQEYYDKSCS